MPKSKTTQKPVEEITYEEALAELEGIVETLESEASQNLLNEAITLFERGQALVAHCGALLDSARLKVQKITGDALSDFEDETE